MSTAVSTLDVTVASRTSETNDIITLELVNANGEGLPAFDAGAHIDIHIPGGIIRQYSLCNDPSEKHRYKVGILKDAASRGGSIAIHENIKEGDTLTISTPRNHFPLAKDAQHSILLAGGIGVTPILCMAERLTASDSSFELHYCTRTPERTAFKNRIAKSSYAAKVIHHFDNGAKDQLLDIPNLLAKPTAGTHLYVCGPKGFMDIVLSTARTAGWQEEQLHYEFFSGEVAIKEDDGSFELYLAKSDKTLKIGAEETIIDALENAGIEIAVSCESGVCGTCLTKIIEGTPDHRDMYLTPKEQAKNDQFLPCCSRSKTPRLVVDI